jgi:hypothetical protein
MLPSHSLSSPHRPIASIKTPTAIFDGPRMASVSTPNMLEHNERCDTSTTLFSSSSTTHLVSVASRLSGELSIGLDCLQKAIKLPTGEQLSDWIIVHGKYINIIYIHTYIYVILFYK